MIQIFSGVVLKGCALPKRPRLFVLREHRKLHCVHKEGRIHFFCPLDQQFFPLLRYREHGDGGADLKNRANEVAHCTGGAPCDDVKCAYQFFCLAAFYACEVCSDQYQINIILPFYFAKLFPILPAKPPPPPLFYSPLPSLHPTHSPTL